MIKEMRGFLDEEDKRKTDNLSIVKILLAPEMEHYQKAL